MEQKQKIQTAGSLTHKPKLLLLCAEKFRNKIAAIRDVIYLANYLGRGQPIFLKFVNAASKSIIVLSKKKQETKLCVTCLAFHQYTSDF